MSYCNLILDLNCKVEFFARDSDSDDEDYDGSSGSGDGDRSLPYVEWIFVSGDTFQTLASRGVSKVGRVAQVAKCRSQITEMKRK